MKKFMDYTKWTMVYRLIDLFYMTIIIVLSLFPMTILVNDFSKSIHNGDVIFSYIIEIVLVLIMLVIMVYIIDSFMIMEYNTRKLLQLEIKDGSKKDIGQTKVFGSFIIYMLIIDALIVSISNALGISFIQEDLLAVLLLQYLIMTVYVVMKPMMEIIKGIPSLTFNKKIIKRSQNYIKNRFVIYNEKLYIRTSNQSIKEYWLNDLDRWYYLPLIYMASISLVVLYRNVSLLDATLSFGIVVKSISRYKGLYIYLWVIFGILKIINWFEKRPLFTYLVTTCAFIFMSLYNIFIIAFPKHSLNSLVIICFPLVLAAILAIIKKVKPSFTYVIDECENYQLITNQILIKDIGENPLVEQFNTALYSNKSEGAVLVSGEWGLGKTRFIKERKLDKFEVDLLNYGSGQKIYYSIFKILPKKFGSLNMKINIKSLLKNPELVIILIIANLSLIPVIKFGHDIQGLNNEPYNLMRVFIVSVLWNYVGVMILPSLAFNKDIENNKFRDVYLDHIAIKSMDKIVVFENLDRLEWDKIFEVLELINYLVAQDVKVVVAADKEYLEHKFPKLSSDDKYTKLYLNRYFKETIVLPNTSDRKIEIMRRKIKEKSATRPIFIAPYEWKTIKCILDDYNNVLMIRELEYFIDRYRTNVVTNQFSLDLFLYANKAKPGVGSEKEIWTDYVIESGLMYSSKYISSIEYELTALYFGRYLYSNYEVDEQFKLNSESSKKSAIQNPIWTLQLESYEKRVLNRLRIEDKKLIVEHICNSIDRTGTEEVIENYVREELNNLKLLEHTKKYNVKNIAAQIYIDYIFEYFEV